jgi:hypothetical protein
MMFHDGTGGLCWCGSVHDVAGSLALNLAKPLFPFPRRVRSAVATETETGRIHMARTTTTVITDDLTGQVTETADEYTITIGDVTGKLDLSPRTYDALVSLVKGDGPAALIRLFGKPGRKAPQTRAAAAGGTGSETPAIRAWGKSNGYDVKDRGALSPDLITAYRAAHRAPAAPKKTAPAAEDKPVMAAPPLGG